MPFVLLFVVLAYLLIAEHVKQQCQAGVGKCAHGDRRVTSMGEVAFTIEQTWNDQPVLPHERVNIVLSADKISNDITMEIDAPFYDDPSPDGPQGEPFMNLWDYEVVEAFFLNEKKQYLEVEVGPHGHHIVLLLDGQRNVIRHSLPLTVTTEKRGSRWVGEAVLPASYFPPQVSKFNAYAINGIGMERRYMALYPAHGSTAEPDFHNLDFFKPIQMDRFNSFLGTNAEMSSVWRAALNSTV